jgi:pimeloyl-ACP methyl ester carboxylesterase
MATNDPAALIRFGKAIFGRTSVLNQMSQIELPTLIIVGAEDTVTPPVKAHRMAEAIPKSQLEVVPASGHMSSLEQPEYINRLLTAFLDGLSPQVTT